MQKRGGYIEPDRNPNRRSDYHIKKKRVDRQDAQKNSEAQRFVDVPEEIYTSVPTVGQVLDEQERVSKVLDMLKSEEDLIKRDSDMYYSTYKKLERYLEV